MSAFAEALGGVEAELRLCSVGLCLRELDEDSADDLQNALDNPGLQGQTIARALSSLGYEIAGNTVQRHRRRICKCPR